MLTIHKLFTNSELANFLQRYPICSLVYCSLFKILLAWISILITSWLCKIRLAKEVYLNVLILLTNKIQLVIFNHGILHISAHRPAV